jgi:hypothetical protein
VKFVFSTYIYRIKKRVLFFSILIFSERNTTNIYICISKAEVDGKAYASFPYTCLYKLVNLFLFFLLFRRELRKKNLIGNENMIFFHFQMCVVFKFGLSSNRKRERGKESFDAHKNIRQNNE